MATKVTNKSPGGRGFTVKVGAAGVEQVILQPGETADLEIFDPKNPIYKFWVDKGEIVYGADEKQQTEAAQAAPAPANAPVVQAAPAVVQVPTSAPPAAATPPAARPAPAASAPQPAEAPKKA
jgi:hypothetical protein